MFSLKVFWAFRAIIYGLFFQRFGFPSYIGEPIYLRGVSRVSIAARVRIYPGARIEVLGGAGIEISRNVSVGQGLHVISGKKVFIGKDVTISANVFISDVEHEYGDYGTHVMEQPLTYNEVAIGDCSFIGFGSVIRAGTSLGKHCVVGANSVVSGIFPDGCVIAGAPARVIKKYDFQSKCWERV